jgi:hypothetical protein
MMADKEKKDGKKEDEVFVSTIYGGPQDQQNPSGYQVMRRKGDKAENVGKEFNATELEKAEKLAEKYRGMGPIRKKVYDVTGFKKGGMVGSASKRADGCAQRGKTRGKMV